MIVCDRSVVSGSRVSSQLLTPSSAHVRRRRNDLPVMKVYPTSLSLSVCLSVPGRDTSVLTTLLASSGSEAVSFIGFTEVQQACASPSHAPGGPKCEGNRLPDPYL